MNQDDLTNLNKAFNLVCDSITVLEQALEKFTEYKQFFPRPLHAMSASDKLRLSRDILKLTGAANGTSNTTTLES